MLTDLHAHITGSLKAEHIFDFIVQNDIHINCPIELDDASSFLGYSFVNSIIHEVIAREKFIINYLCKPNGKKRFNEVMKRFNLISFLLIIKPEWIIDVGELVAKDFKDQHITYVEWRIDPFSGNNGHFQYGEQKIRRVYEGLSKVSGIDSKIVLSVAKNRYSDSGLVNWNKLEFLHGEMYELLKSLKDIPLVGFDLCNSDSIRLQNFEDVIRCCTENLAFIPHCGEGTSRSVEEDLETIHDVLDCIGVCYRIGHGIATYRNLDDYLGLCDSYGKIYNFDRIKKLKDDQENLLDRIKSEEVVFEVCPTSNLSAHLGYEDYSKHPINRLIEKDIPFIVATDDQGIFGVTLEQEINNLGLDRRKVLENNERYKCLIY